MGRIKAQIQSKKEVQMFKRLWKGAPINIGVVALIVIAIVMSAGMARAAFEVDNWASIIYYTNVQYAFPRTDDDTACLRILYGPEMVLTKYVTNLVTGNVGDTVPIECARGDTIEFTL